MEHGHQVPDAIPVVAGGCFILFAVLMGLLISIFMVWLFCRIFSKAGYSWAFGLLILVPFGQIIILLILAFGDWPALRQIPGGTD